MSPHYFLHEITLAEVNDYIKGQDRRHRQGWEQARMVSSYMVASMGGEPNISLPWDEDNQTKKDTDPEEEAKKFEALKARAKQMTEYLKKQKEKKHGS